MEEVNELHFRIKKVLAYARKKMNWRTDARDVLTLSERHTIHAGPIQGKFAIVDQNGMQRAVLLLTGLDFRTVPLMVKALAESSRWWSPTLSTGRRT